MPNVPCLHLLGLIGPTVVLKDPKDPSESSPGSLLSFPSSVSVSLSYVNVTPFGTCVGESGM
jgi:hypothetical protein